MKMRRRRWFGMMVILTRICLENIHLDELLSPNVDILLVHRIAFFCTVSPSFAQYHLSGKSHLSNPGKIWSSQLRSFVPGLRYFSKIEAIIFF